MGLSSLFLYKLPNQRHAGVLQTYNGCSEPLQQQSLANVPAKWLSYISDFTSDYLGHLFGLPFLCDQNDMILWPPVDLNINMH